MSKNKLRGSKGIVRETLRDVFGNPLQNATDQLYGIVSGRQLVKYASGARTILRVNGEIVGFAFSISWDINTEHKDIHGIDNYFPEDTAPTMVSVSGTIGAFHIPGKGPTAQEWQANFKSFLTHKYITIEARDTQTNELLFYTDKARIVNRSQSIQEGQLSRMQLRFKAIGWLDEIEAIAEGIDTPEGVVSDDGRSSQISRSNLNIF